MGIGVYPAPASGAKLKQIDLITATGTWTAPPGVDYVIAHLVAGGPGNAGRGGTDHAADGGSSSAFGYTLLGPKGGTRQHGSGSNGVSGQSMPANTGLGGGPAGNNYANVDYRFAHSTETKDSPKVSYGSVVTTGATYTITVGAGGAAANQGGAGGSGYVEIEYYIDA